MGTMPLAAGGDLCLDRITKTYGRVVAVDDLTLDVPQGCFFALLGPSGCGKTTTLRIVAGLERASAGRVELGGVDLTQARAYRRPVNTVFQSYALFPHLSVLENVAFGPRRRRVPDPVRRAREALDLVRLGEYGARRPADLSGGQQQRVALARALVNEPAVLLLDEPLGALDLKLRREMQAELRRLHCELGTTFVHVTHDQEEALAMADLVAVMNKGRIEQLGPPAQLYERPASRFTATFLGRSNLTRARVTGSSGAMTLIDVAGVVVPVASGLADRGASHLEVGIRPEKLELLSAPPSVASELEPVPVTDSGAVVLGPGRVVDLSFTGVSTEHVVDLPGVGRWTVFTQNRNAEPAVVGDEVWVRWEARHVFVLDAAPS